MLEQDDGSYSLSTSSSWPSKGYIFDSALSKCENGGQISWNNHAVVEVKVSSDLENSIKYINIFLN